MSDDNVYDVIVTREDGAWLADVPDLPGAHTFARSLPSLRESVREVIVLMDDLVDDVEPQVRFHYDVDDPLIREAAAFGFKREEIAAYRKSLQTSTAEMARKLAEAGLSVRDSAALLGITPGRVSQLVSQRRSA